MRRKASDARQDATSPISLSSSSPPEPVAREPSRKRKRSPATSQPAVTLIDLTLDDADVALPAPVPAIPDKALQQPRLQPDAEAGHQFTVRSTTRRLDCLLNGVIKAFAVTKRNRVAVATDIGELVIHEGEDNLRRITVLRESAVSALCTWGERLFVAAAGGKLFSIELDDPASEPALLHQFDQPICALAASHHRLFVAIDNKVRGHGGERKMKK